MEKSLLQEKYNQYKTITDELKKLLIDAIKTKVCEHINETHEEKMMLDSCDNRLDLARYTGDLYEESDIAQALFIVDEKVQVECECDVYDLEDDLDIDEVYALFILIGLSI